MKRHRTLLLAVAAVISAAPAFAGPNDPPRGARAVPPPVADGTLGMALMAAAVSATGVLDRGTGVTSVNKLGAPAGNYEVNFERNVTACFFTATIGPSGTGSATGQINVAARFADPNGVFVDTNDIAGASADRPFHLIVFCPR